MPPCCSWVELLAIAAQCGTTQQMQTSQLTAPALLFQLGMETGTPALTLLHGTRRSSAPRGQRLELVRGSALGQRCFLLKPLAPVVGNLSDESSVLGGGSPRTGALHGLIELQVI